MPPARPHPALTPRPKAAQLFPVLLTTGELHPYDTSAVPPEHRRETILPTGAPTEQPSATEQASPPGNS